MKERIFFISPLPEEDEDEDNLYDKYGKSTASTYYDERGAVPQEKPKENHIYILYEAPKSKVVTQQDQLPEPTPASIELISHASPTESCKTFETYKAYGNLLNFMHEEQPTYKAYGNLLNFMHEEQPVTQPKSEENQLTAIRSEIQELTPAT